MSYILDALNKSENERRAAATPGLMPGASFVVAPQKRSRHGSAAFVLAGGMLVAGLALGSWRPWQAPAADGAPRVVALLTAETPVAEAAAPAVPAAAAPKAAAKPVTAPSKAVKGPAAEKVAAATAPAGEKLKAKAAAKPVAGARAEPLAVPAAVAPVVAAEAPAAPREKRIVRYGELPAAVRQNVPAISYGGFAGTDDDAVNIAFINNRLVKAGEEVSPGVKLESVAHDGVVLAYQGYRFKP